MNESIIKKIKKLLSLSTSPNKSEANLAYKKAMELMLKHNIESVNQKKEYGSNIRFSNIETQEIKFINEILVRCFFTQIVTRRVYCEIDRRIKTRYTYYASDTNLEISMYAFDFLKKELPMMWRLAQRKNNLSRNEKQSYYYGIVHGFSKVYNEVKSYSENKYELVLIDNDPELDAFIKERHKKLKESTVKVGQIKPDAFSQGVEDGKELKINKAVEGKNSSSSTLLLN